MLRSAPRQPAQLFLQPKLAEAGSPQQSCSTRSNSSSSGEEWKQGCEPFQPAFFKPAFSLLEELSAPLFQQSAQGKGSQLIAAVTPKDLGETWVGEIPGRQETSSQSTHLSVISGGAKYKTVKCRYFHGQNYCKFGVNCQYIHEEEPRSFYESLTQKILAMERLLDSEKDIAEIFEEVETCQASGFKGSRLPVFTNF